MASIENRGKNTYRFIYSDGYDQNDKQIKRTKTIKYPEKPKKEQLKSDLAKFVTEIESGLYIAPQKMTFADFVNEWRTKHAEEVLAPTTLRNYLEHLERTILPVFGHKQLADIKTMHIVTFIKELRAPSNRKDGKDAALSPSTVLYVYKILKSILKKATVWRLIPANPMDGVTQPSVPKQKRKFYDSEEAAVVIQALYKEPTVWRLFCLGALLGGFRRGELLGLEWPQVDFKNNIINVVQNIPLTENGEAVVTTPKTEASEDFVDMPPWYMEELKAFHEEWRDLLFNSGASWEGGERRFVFHSGLGKPYFHNTPSLWWRRFLKRHGLRPVRLHDLRHSTASILLEDNVPLKVIQERLRHSTYSITANLYAHVTPKTSRQAANTLEKFNPKKNPQIIPREQI